MSAAAAVQVFLTRGQYADLVAVDPVRAGQLLTSGKARIDG